jgi:hypothetical protein
MPSPKTNSMVFGVLMIFTQICLATFNGVFIRPIDQNTATGGAAIVPQYLFQPIAIAFVTVLGFGLIFSYNKKLLFSGLGFTLFIFAFVIQYYPLINAFWTKTQIMGDYVANTPTPQFNSNVWYSYFLTRGSGYSVSPF